MLKGIFYARFHPERGPSIVHQYPANSITTSSSSHEALLNFSDISSYIIPPYEVCNRPVSICTDGYRVLGFPVSLEDAKYSRNRFTFNLCFVLDDDVDSRPWEQVVRKAANYFRAMEEEDGILQAEELLEGLKWAGEEGYPAPNVGVLRALLEATLEDLNIYGEPYVRLNDLHVLNLRLMAPKRTPPKVASWDVPLLIRALPTPDEWTWDLTLQRIHPHLDGVKHIQRIAELADVELKLVKKAVQELLHHERAIILDVFHFQAFYALTSDFAYFAKDAKMQEDCCAYIATDSAKNIFKVTNTAMPAQPAKETVTHLYRTLNPGINLQEFCLAHEADLSNIDIRRFITFGVIKGFLRRIHRYALAIDSQPPSPQTRLSNGSLPWKAKSSQDSALEIEKAWKKAALSSGWPTPPMEPPLERLRKDIAEEEEQSEEDERLRRFLDGRHSLDEICVFLHMSEKKVVETIRSGKFGEVVLFCK